MDIDATVLEVYDDRLLVMDSSNNQEILVNTRFAGRFLPGDIIRISYNGMMTRSIPPQITATSILMIERPPAPAPPAYSELRAVIVYRRNNSLIVRELNTNNQFIVEYNCARCFRVGQRITVRYETIFLGEPPNPSRIIATNIAPLT